MEISHLCPMETINSFAMLYKARSQYEHAVFKEQLSNKKELTTFSNCQLLNDIVFLI